MIRICEAHEVTEALIEAFARLLPQLSERLTAPDRETVARIVAAPATRQLTAVTDEGRIVGLLSVAFYDVPSGRKAWIEDVVVDGSMRGKSLGRALLDHAMGYARRMSPATLMLTSRPSRAAANALYLAAGFEPKETNVYKIEL